MCECVGVCVRVRASADPVIMVFVFGAGCGFLCVCRVVCKLFEGTYLNFFVTVTCFVARVMLSLLINDFICK